MKNGFEHRSLLTGEMTFIVFWIATIPECGTQHDIKYKYWLDHFDWQFDYLLLEAYLGKRIDSGVTLSGSPYFKVYFHVVI